MTAINRVKRSLFRAGELQECLLPTCSQGFEVPAVEVLSAQDGSQDGIDASRAQFRDGFEAVGQRRPVELNPQNRLLTSADFQQQLQATLDGTSPRAQQVKQVESTYEAFWKDEQDFAVRQARGPALRVPERQGVEDARELERVQQVSQTSAAALEARRIAEVAEQPFSLLGRVEIRA